MAAEEEAPVVVAVLVEEAPAAAMVAATAEVMVVETAAAMVAVTVVDRVTGLLPLPTETVRATPRGRAVRTAKVAARVVVRWRAN